MPSSFLAEIGTISQRVDELVRSSRTATRDELNRLELEGNVITGEIRFIGGSTWSNQTFPIRNNVFLNTVLINLEGGVSTKIQICSDVPCLAAGIFSSTLSNTVVDGYSFVKDCCMIHSAYIGPGCAFMSNGVVTGNLDADVYGIGSELILCEETGSRAILTDPDSNLESVTAAISSKFAIREFHKRVEHLISDIRSVCIQKSYMGSIFARNSVCLKNTALRSVYLASNSRVSGSEVKSSIIQSECQVENAFVEKSMINKFSRVENFSVVENSVLAEYSKISIHGKVVHSYIGSYSGVESGECVSSLIGPFVGFHHQSLCIAAYWPGGRGNIGYGANVGSNHSGKAPDCELLSGEGMFYGLAVVVKFPSNFLKAPYTLIASGVTCLPQRLEFPFSLINTGNISSSGLNEISPAWVLSDNMFTLMRNEDKFRKRQKGNASCVYEHQVFRPEIISLVCEARDRLRDVASQGPEGVYTESDITGLGKNYLREPTRLRAIDTYSFIIRWFGLRGLYREILARGPNCALEGTPSVEFSFCKKILESEKMNLNETKSLLNEYRKLDFLISSNCVVSKAKDDVRGEKIIGPQYTEFHQPASEHPVCVGAKKSSAEVDRSVGDIVSRL
jgi:hypothetical protein